MKIELLLRAIIAILPWLKEVTKEGGFTSTYFIFAMLYLLGLLILIAADLYLTGGSSNNAEHFGNMGIHHP